MIHVSIILHNILSRDMRKYTSRFKECYHFGYLQSRPYAR